MFKRSLLVFIAIVLLVRSPLRADEETLKPEYQKLVRVFVAAIKADDRKAVAKLVKYPLRQEYPIPYVHNEKEFLQRFDQIFDKDLCARIAHSSIAKDWTAVGWRGIMLDRGLLWLDQGGTLIAVNYRSKAEDRFKGELIKRDKERLHHSLREFEKPELVGETDKLLVRIDVLKDEKYRYAVWPKGSPFSRKPDLVLKNGEVIFEGSGGNHYFEFKNGEYRYRLYVWVIGAEDTPPGLLEIYKSDKLLSKQDIKNLKPGP